MRDRGPVWSCAPPPLPAPLPDLGADAEMFAASAQYDDAHRRVDTEICDLFQQRIQHALIIAVALFRPIERERRDPASVDGAEHRGIRFRRAHGEIPGSSERSENRPMWLSSPP